MYTDTFIARPSFLSGVARLFDFGGLLNSYRTVATDPAAAREADALALYADWRSVGADLRTAMDRFKAEHDLRQSGSPTSPE